MAPRSRGGRVPILRLEAKNVVHVEDEIEIGIIIVLVVYPLGGLGQHAPRIEARHVAKRRVAGVVGVIDAPCQAAKWLIGVLKGEGNGFGQ